jgi:glyoxylate utilization-related uncharacterized protein
MKTRFEIETDVFGGSEPEEVKGGLAIYNNCYKPLGYLIDKSEHTVYKIFDNFIKLNKGDRVFLKGYGCGIVRWVCYYVEEDMVTYVLDEE